MSGQQVVVATHGHCFDGMCSAVMFTRLLRHLDPRTTYQFAYRSLGYGPAQVNVDKRTLAGQVNAILDFRFSPAKELTWYFDHHVSAFASPQDRAVYDAHVAAEDTKPSRRMFHDGTYGSCTKLIADVGSSQFDLDWAPVAELVRWADMIDSAAFPNATMAVERKEPVLQLMTVVEHLGDDAFLSRMVPRLLNEPLEEVARAQDVQSAYQPLRVSHEAFIELVKKHAKPVGSVVLVDLTEAVLEVAGKFVTYALYPESAYSVLLSRSKSKLKISIGYNPWSPIPRTHNVAAICERFGGGGHPVVGAISLTSNELERARKISSDIAEELAS